MIYPKRNYSNFNDFFDEDFNNLDSNYKCEENCKIKQHCSLEGVKPATLSIPFPDLKVVRPNVYYADILSEDFAGMTSELSAITQYVNHEIRTTITFCKAARVFLSIAQAEMIHLNRIGELIILLGGESCSQLKFDTCKNLCSTPWTPDYLNYAYGIKDMIRADLSGEFHAIAQYKEHMEEICDPCIKANLARIIKDELYHTRLLKQLLRELDC